MKLRQLDDVWNRVMTNNIEIPEDYQQWVDKCIESYNKPDCKECWAEVEKWKQRFIGAVMIHSYGEDIEDIVKAIEEL